MTITTSPAERLAASLNEYDAAVRDGSRSDAGGWWREIADAEPYASVIDHERTGDRAASVGRVCLLDGSQVAYSGGRWVVT